MAKPYFREWSNMDHHKGKSFLCPPRLFKDEHAMFFPNIAGRTLQKQKRKSLDHTTSILMDRVSVVAIYSSQWAEHQVESFTAQNNNPELHKVLEENHDLAQFVQISVEEDSLKAMLIQLFKRNLRKRVGEGNWGRYFLVRRGLSDETKDAIGLLNGKVGYTYLLDRQCKIRWAGSGLAYEGEKEGLVKGVKRLVEELRASKEKDAKVEEESKKIEKTESLAPRGTSAVA